MVSLELHSQYVIALSNAFNNHNPEKLIRLENLLSSPNKFTNQLREDGLKTSILDRYHKDYCELIKAKPPHPYQRETIEQSTQDITDKINDFKTSLPTLVSRMLLKQCIRFGLKEGNLTQSGLFKNSVDQIRNSFSDLNPMCIFTPDSSHQVLLVNNQRDRIDKIKNVLEKHASTHHIVSFQEDDKSTRAKGLVLVCTASPQDMEDSTTKLFEKMNVFFDNNSIAQKTP